MTLLHPERITACVFDAYGTLFDVHTPAKRLEAELGDRAQRLSEIWRTKQLQYTWLRSLMGRFEDFWQITGEALDFAMASVGIDDLTLRSRLIEQYFRLDLYPDVLPGLRRLHAAGKSTAILSNGSANMLAAAVGNAGLRDLIDATLSADAVKIFKPDPRVYELASDHFRIDKQQICFVSSNGWDAAGAACFGFRVAWLNRDKSARETLPPQPDVEINSLAELADMLGV